MGELMRPLDELARLGNDALLRLPRASFLQVPRSWPLAAAAGGALLTLVGTGSSQVASQPNQPSVTTATVSSGNCSEQTWPYLSDECLQRARPAATGVPAKPVRVIQPDEAMAKAAIGTTEWTRRAASSPNPPAARQKSRQKERGQDRVVTVRSGRQDRRAAQQRVYRVPADAYYAYGSAPR